MKILSFEVVDLLGIQRVFRTTFNADLNIFTGRNGSGKTSVLKLMWYIMSGNILLALNEIPFQRATLTTDAYECVLIKLSRNTCKVEFTVVGGTKQIFEDQSDEDAFANAEDEANPRLTEQGSSVFFPTFRRIEGGFSLETTRPGNPTLRQTAPFGRPARNDVEDALVALSRKLTNGNHIFVTAISTVDIVGLLLRQFTDLSEVSNRLQQSTSQDIIQRIKSFKQDEVATPNPDQSGTRRLLIDAVSVLDEISASIVAMEDQREATMSPITAVQSLVQKLIRHSGIRFDARLNFGDAANAVNSGVLSAGEKQMLSFICYNAFYKNTVFFVDEPELSLHVDWQRQLFSVLQNQKSSNQFVVATHSPFIYSKYPEKEILLSTDRGDEDEPLDATAPKISDNPR
ncbi:MAG: AAA family ATPase [Xanthobacteraceae bacterium]